MTNPEERVLERFDTWSQDFLERSYEDNTLLQEQPVHASNPMVLNVLDQAYEEHARSLYDNLNSGKGFRFEGKLKENFFRNLQVFAREKYEEGENTNQLDTFLLALHSHCFNHHHFCGSIPVFEKILLTSEMNEHPVLRGNLGQELVATTVHDLSFMQGPVVKSLEAYQDQLSPGDSLRLLYQLPTIGAQAMATSSWAGATEESIKLFLQSQIDKPTTSLLEKFVAERGMAVLRSEEDEPSQNVVTYQGNEQAGRMREHNESLNKEHQALVSVVQPSIPMEPGFKVIRSAVDRLTVFDRTGMPLYQGYLSPEQNKQIEERLTQPPDYDFPLEVIHDLANFIKQEADIEDIQVKKEIYEHLHAYYQGSGWGAFLRTLNPSITDESINALERAKELYGKVHQIQHDFYLQHNQPMERADFDSLVASMEPELSQVNQQATDLMHQFPLPVLEKQFSTILDIHRRQAVHLEVKPFRAVAQDRRVNMADTLSEDDVVTLTYLLRPDIQHMITTYFGVDFSQLTMAEQVYFSQLLTSQDNQQLETLREITQAGAVDADALVSCFVATQVDSGIAETIMTIAQNPDTQAVNSVLHAYSTMARLAQEIENGYGQNPHIARTYLKRANDLLHKAAEGDISIMAETMQAMRAENLLLVEAYRAMKTEGEVDDITDFEKVQAQTYTSLPPGIKELFDGNYEPERATNLYQDLVSNQEQVGFRLHTVEFDGQIVSAMYEYSLDRGRVYLGGLNMTSRHDLKGLPGGQALLSRVFNQHVEQGTVIEASATLLNAERYMNQYGFVLTGTVELASHEQDENGLYFGDQIYVLEMTPQQSYRSREERYTREVIKDMAQSGQQDAKGRIVVWQTLSETEPPSELSSGYVCTQTFRSVSENRRYFLLERLSTTEAQQNLN